MKRKPPATHYACAKCGASPSPTCDVVAFLIAMLDGWIVPGSATAVCPRCRGEKRRKACKPRVGVKE